MIATLPSGRKSRGIVGGGRYIYLSLETSKCVRIQMSAIAKPLATSEAAPPTSPDHVFDMRTSCLVSPSYCDLVLGSQRIFILKCHTQAGYCKTSRGYQGSVHARHEFWTTLV